MNRLKRLDLSSLQTVADNAIATFYQAQMESLMELTWPHTLAHWPELSFAGMNAPSLSGIQLGIATTFAPSTFEGIANGPEDMKILDGKTHQDLIYMNDMYGYESSPIGITPNGNLFKQTVCTNCEGELVSELSLTHVNDNPLPYADDSVSIKKDGSMTVKASGSSTVTILFATSSGLTGARKLTISGKPA